MSRRYDEPVDVRRRDDVPAEFLWHGRLYVVRDVLAHWVETGAWWRTPAAKAVYGLTDDLRDDTGGDPAPTGLALDESERELWRVEASAGRAQGSGVYDLCFDWSGGRWTLARAQD
jgi:hypothetical protein